MNKIPKNITFKSKIFILSVLMCSLLGSAIESSNKICEVGNCQNCTYGFFLPPCSSMSPNITNEGKYCYGTPVCCKEHYSEWSNAYYCSNYNMYPMCEITCRDIPPVIIPETTISTVNLNDSRNDSNNNYDYLYKLLYGFITVLCLVTWREFSKTHKTPTNLNSDKKINKNTKLTSFVPVREEDGDSSNAEDDAEDDEEDDDEDEEQ